MDDLRRLAADESCGVSQFLDALRSAALESARLNTVKAGKVSAGSTCPGKIILPSPSE